MSINPIELLKEKVTPQVVSRAQLEIDADKKASLLAQFYPVLLSLLHKFPNRAEAILAEKDKALSILFSDHAAAIKQLVHRLAKHHSLPDATVLSLIEQSVVPSVEAVKKEVGVASVSTYLAEHVQNIASSFPAWGAGLIATLGLGTVLGQQSQSQHIYAKAPPKPPHVLRKIFPILALVVLAVLIAFLLKYCQRVEPTGAIVVPTSSSEASTTSASTITASEVAQNLKPAYFSIASTKEGAPLSCQANVGNTALASTIQTTVTKVFSASQPCGIQVDSGYATELPSAEILESVLSAIKTVPHSSFEWTGNHLVINADKEEERKELLKHIKMIAPKLDVSIAPTAHTESSVVQSVDQSIQDSKQALATLNEQANPQDIVNALNVQIINFPTASKALPAQNKEILDQAALLIKKIPNVKLVAEGYTDSTGNAEANKKLSQNRAQSVVDYLVSKGVAHDQIRAVGYGSENPIADNATEQGRFKNRRIEFKLVSAS